MNTEDSTPCRRVLLVADDPVSIRALQRTMGRASGLEVTGVRCGDISVPAGHVEPDVVVVRVTSKPTKTLAQLIVLRQELPDATIVLLSVDMEAAWAGDCFRAGASALVSLSVSADALATLVRETASGKIIRLPASPASPRVDRPHPELTPREQEVLTHIADGLTNAQIGRHLWLSEQTVKFHVRNVLRKLEAGNRTEAARKAHLNGLLEATDLPSRPADRRPSAHAVGGAGHGAPG